MTEHPSIYDLPSEQSIPTIITLQEEELHTKVQSILTAYEESKDFRQARKAMEEILDALPKSARGFYYNAIVEAEGGNFKEAHASLEHAFKLDRSLVAIARKDPQLDRLREGMQTIGRYTERFSWQSE